MRVSRRFDRAHLRMVSRRRAALRARSGFTIIELVVAMFIMTVGVLALATGSAGVAKQMRAGNQAALAAVIGQGRLETIRSLGCSSLSDGTATTRGMTEKWTITWISAKARAVTESVTYVPRATVSKTMALRSVVPCA
jgi:prepilin-type N-terminal cleavage/methylation domain-containing protein